jgi:hypothetical protein
MADASWVHLGRDYTYGLILEGRIVGIAYWQDAEILGEDAQHEPAVTGPGWFWTATDSPWERRRVAQGLELTAEMGEEELGQTVVDALKVIADEVHAEGGDDESPHPGVPNELLAERGDGEWPHRGSQPDTPVLVVVALVLIVWAVARRRER